MMPRRNADDPCAAHPWGGHVAGRDAHPCGAHGNRGGIMIGGPDVREVAPVHVPVHHGAGPPTVVGPGPGDLYARRELRLGGHEGGGEAAGHDQRAHQQAFHRGLLSPGMPGSRPHLHGKAEPVPGPNGQYSRAFPTGAARRCPLVRTGWVGLCPGGDRAPGSPPHPGLRALNATLREACPTDPRTDPDPVHPEPRRGNRLTARLDRPGRLTGHGASWKP